MCHCAHTCASPCRATTMPQMTPEDMAQALQGEPVFKQAHGAPPQPQGFALWRPILWQAFSYGAMMVCLYVPCHKKKSGHFRAGGCTTWDTPTSIIGWMVGSALWGGGRGGGAWHETPYGEHMSVPGTCSVSPQWRCPNISLAATNLRFPFSGCATNDATAQ